jgi:hypothetical protein
MHACTSDGPALPQGGAYTKHTLALVSDDIEEHAKPITIGPPHHPASNVTYNRTASEGEKNGRNCRTTTTATSTSVRCSDDDQLETEDL